MSSWVVDQAHSTVGFEVKHLMISKVKGQFDAFSVHIEANDLMDLTTSNIAFKIDSSSINTRNGERDKHLKSVDFLHIENFPTIDFTSTLVLKSEDGYKITGDLTMRGVTNPVTFNVEFGGKAISHSGVEVYGFEAEATINREEFGLVWNAALETGGMLVGKEVKIKVELEISQPASIYNSSSSGTLSSVEHKPWMNETLDNDIHRIVTENITDLVLIMNKDGIIQYATPSFKTSLKYDFSDLQNKNFFEKIHPNEQDTIKKEILSYCSRTLKKELKSEFGFLHSDGHYITVEAYITDTKEAAYSTREKELILIVMRDISERKEGERAIYQLAFHDPLTSLPNRRMMTNQLRNEVMDRKLSRSKLALFVIDLDNFKTINDQWGHDEGDFVLKEAARKIQSALRPTDIVARFGGDEFVALIKDVEHEEDAIAIAQRILDQFQNPISRSGQEYTLSASIGVALYPDHGESPEELFKHADIALYNVKGQGKNAFMVFDQLMKDKSLEQRLLENALRQGIKEQQFYLEYQPKINLSTNELIGMEALVRWNHPELGIIPPGKFIPMAEETGLIVPLGEWILKESCLQTISWQNKGYPPLIVSVNVSVRQLEDRNFVEKLKAILQETGLDPRWLEIEITESVLANVKSTISILKEIQKLGIHISIDDFGTGYSSLSYIKELPIDTLKIDQSFVKDIHKDKESKEIVKTIINLAHSIGLNVIAEGIELKEHVDELNKDGNILGQGYFYSRPLKGEAFEDFMKTASEGP